MPIRCTADRLGPMPRRKTARIAGEFSHLVSLLLVFFAAQGLLDPRPAAAQGLTLQPIASGLARPIDIAHAGDGSGRLFIALQRGEILIHDGERILPTPFLDIAPLVRCCGERGLLGFAFHPNYAENGYLYVNYTDKSGATVIARYQVSADSNVVDPASATELLTVTQPYSNHNGGQLRFGPDGYLYIALGDGGSGGDPQNFGQNLESLLGKMLRIDVDSQTPYAIPSDNPTFDNENARPEIWALGLRNPWRFSFDRKTGDLFIADVGQGRREEIDFQPADSKGGENYGWRCFEGRLSYSPSTKCDEGNLIEPILDYDHSGGNCSVTGGYRYRGTPVSAFVGDYFFADFCTGRIWAATQQGDGSWLSREILDTDYRFSTFGEDETGELYIAHLNNSNGIVFRMVFDKIGLGNVAIDETWKNASFDQDYQDPIVIAGPPTYRDDQPGTVRLRDVTATGFQARFQEWDYLDGAHALEDLPFLVMERSRQQMPDGSLWEAGSFVLNETRTWQATSFSEAFPGAPALYLTLQTDNGPSALTVRARSVTAQGFEAAMFEQEARIGSANGEEVGYLAVYSPKGSGTIGDTPYLLQAPLVNQAFTPVASATLKVEEEKSKDPEVGHTKETLSVLALGKHIFAQDVSTMGKDTIALRRLAPAFAAPMEWGTVDGLSGRWLTVPLHRTYAEPVVVARPVSANGRDPGVIQIRNVTPGSFQLRYKEWRYLDGRHTAERVFFLVAEAGQHQLAGLAVEAGTLETNELLDAGSEAVSFATAFSEPPAVFSSPQTAKGSDPVTSRIDQVNLDGFLLAMNEEEARQDGHVKETLGWIAIEPGSGVTSDGRDILVFKGTAGDQPGTIPFGQRFERRFPVVLADVLSKWEADPVFLRHRNLRPDQIELYLQEEQSLDPETSHADEDISIFVAE